MGNGPFRCTRLYRGRRGFRVPNTLADVEQAANLHILMFLTWIIPVYTEFYIRHFEGSK